MLVIIDNGHGVDTQGKRSPVWSDGARLFEYEFNRDVAALIAYKCKCNNIPFKMLVTEAHDISLAERVRRVNELCDKHLGCILLSIHANAGMGTGWEAWTSVGKTESDTLASITDGDPDQESQFYILKHTKCPAVLTENFFMDTERDCRFIMSHGARERIAEMHFRAIKRYINYGKESA